MEWIKFMQHSLQDNMYKANVFFFCIVFLVVSYVVSMANAQNSYD